MSASPFVVTHRRKVHLRTCPHASRIAFPMSWLPDVGRPGDHACVTCLSGLLPTFTPHRGHLMTTPDPGTVERMAEVLRAHRRLHAPLQGCAVCSCGDWAGSYSDTAEHDEHVAHLLAALPAADVGVREAVEAVLDREVPFIPLSSWTPDQEAAALLSHSAALLTIKADLRAALGAAGGDGGGA